MDAMIKELYEITVTINIVNETLFHSEKLLTKAQCDGDMDNIFNVRDCILKINEILDKLYQKQAKIYAELLITVL